MNAFLDLPSASMDEADVILLPLPFEGTVSYGKGTARGPAAILDASRQVETLDEETGFELDKLTYCWAEEIQPAENQKPERYLETVLESATLAHGHRGFVFGIGGEHSLTAPLARAAAGEDSLDDLTVVQFDAHADLRKSYEGSSSSHACVMRGLLDRGASVLAIGIRSLSSEELDHGQAHDRWEPYFARELHQEKGAEVRLLDRLEKLRGRVYLTIDVDCLEVSLAPGTGTPEPGGLRWWQTLSYLRALLRPSPDKAVLGADITETAPMEGSRVNEFTAARLICKLIAYLHQP